MTVQPTYFVVVALVAVLMIGAVVRCTRASEGKSESGIIGAGGQLRTKSLTTQREGRIEIIPQHLYAVVSSENIKTAVDGTLMCWTYLSDGLRSVGQKEVQLTIKQEPAEREPPPDPLLLYREMYQHAEKGEHVDVGSVITIPLGEQASGFLGRTDLRGVAYVPLQSSAQQLLPSPTIGALFVTEAEARAASEFGVLRLMAMLGNQHRCFPTVLWNDRARPELPIVESTAKTLLDQIHHLSGPGMYVELRSEGPTGIQRAPNPRVQGDEWFLQGDDSITHFARATIVVTLPRAAASQFASGALPRDSSMPFALIGYPDPTAVASFAWLPGQKQAEIIGYPGHGGRRISGVFAALGPSREGASNSKLAEDGFIILLAPADWSNVRDAVGAGRDVTVATSGEASSLQILWK
jgi:hypothetical protein